jgi:hypothetical protein
VIERAFSTGQPVRAARNGPSECELECQAVADSVI